MEESKLHQWLVCLHLRVLDFEFYLFQYNAVMTAFKQLYDNRMILKPLASHNLAVKLLVREVDDDRDRIINLGFLRRRPK